MGVGIDSLRTLLLFVMLLVIVGLLIERRMLARVPDHFSLCQCRGKDEMGVIATANQEERSMGILQRMQYPESATSMESPAKFISSKKRYLSYQPPGNGWNNQRIALENALVLAKLLDRTLVVHPLAPHELGDKMKRGRKSGYEVYNEMESHDLLPLSQFIDLGLMAAIVAVEEVVVSHPQFVADYSHLTWRNICHSPGYGFWVDQLPQTSEEVGLLAKQKFSSLGQVWRERCAEEKLRAENDVDGVTPLIKYVSDLQEDTSEMLYFERGTLFGMQIRFTTMEHALDAQDWAVNHIHYNQAIWKTVAKITKEMGSHFNAIQIRRKMHMASKLPPSFWMERMTEKHFSKDVPIYVATNDATKEWFNPFVRDGYRLHFSVDFPQYLSFTSMKESLRKDFLAIHEQCLCEEAQVFVGTPASTFTAFILRHRGEVHRKDKLMMDTLHTYWIGHQIK